MTKAEIISNVWEAAKAKDDKVTKTQVTAVINGLFDTLKDAIKKEGRLSYPEFGVFSLKTRKARDGPNPHTNEPIKIPETITIGFKPAAKLKAELNVKADKADKKVAKKDDKKVAKKDDKKAAKKK